MTKEAQFKIIQKDEKHGQVPGEFLYLKRINTRQETYDKAREVLLTEKYFEKLKRAYEKKEEKRGGDASGFAEIENEFVAFCHNLDNEKISSLVKEFNRKFRDYIPAYLTKIKTTGGIDEKGIMSVVEFLKSRKKFLELKPSQEYAFCFENVLDARNKIDVIEYIYNRNEKGELMVDTMSLIQVKTTEPTEREKEEILEAHKKWLTSSVMDFDTYNRKYSDGIPDNLPMKDLAENLGEIGELFLDMCTDPNGFSIKKFIDKLGLEDFEKLKNKNKAWLLLHYGDGFKKMIIDYRKSKILSENQARALYDVLKKLEEKVKKEITKLKNFSKVKNIYSVIAVGEKIVEKNELQKDNVNPYVIGY